MILAIDTSLRDLHIGLFSDSAEPIAEFHQAASEDKRGIHDELLAQKTYELLKEHSYSAKDISKIALVIGPGSFTGLRIGLAFAKGLAYGSGASIIPIRTDSPIALHTLTEKALKEKGISGGDLAALEPFYGTDFAPTFR